MQCCGSGSLYFGSREPDHCQNCNWSHVIAGIRSGYWRICKEQNLDPYPYNKIINGAESSFSIWWFFLFVDPDVNHLAHRTWIPDMIVIGAMQDRRCLTRILTNMSRANFGSVSLRNYYISGAESSFTIIYFIRLILWFLVSYLAYFISFKTSMHCFHKNIWFQFYLLVSDVLSQPLQIRNFSFKRK